MWFSSVFVVKYYFEFVGGAKSHLQIEQTYNIQNFIIYRKFVGGAKMSFTNRTEI